MEEYGVYKSTLLDINYERRWLTGELVRGRLSQGFIQKKSDNSAVEIADSRTEYISLCA